MITTHVEQNYRYSIKGTYYVFDCETRKSIRLSSALAVDAASEADDDDSNAILHALWSPVGNKLAFVARNNVYIMLDPINGPAYRVTKDGSESIFNGVLDWAYEEEIFSTNNALYWSPDASKLLFLRIDETEVSAYEMPIYGNGDLSGFDPALNASANEDDGSEARTRVYTGSRFIKYPKPGTPNPIVQVLVADIDASVSPTADGPQTRFTPRLVKLDTSISQDDLLITEIAWVDPASVFLRCMNRVQDYMELVLVDVGTLTSIRKLITNGFKAQDAQFKDWIPTTQKIQVIPPRLPGQPYGYLDVAVVGEWIGIVYYPSVKAINTSC